MPVWYMAEMEQYRNKWEKQKKAATDKWQSGDHQYVFHNMAIPDHG